ncbi:hypothetical protein [Flavobacterium sp. XS2P39]|uniref:hypothetical protein n=1 Tax=Flavobacterium sp. XS2P39 TaxID=3401725 RepID=UPI003AB05BA4
MKKLNVFFAAMFFALIFSNSASAQEKSFFIGKWDVKVEGTPGGDSKMIINIANQDGKLSGSAIDPTSNNELFAFTKVEEEANKVTVYFTSQGYDVYMYLEKKDQDNLSGSMMDMFDATGVRLK